MTIKELIATIALISLNNVGLLVIMSSTGFLKAIGYFDYFATILILYFVVCKYMESDFYKNLGKQTSEEIK